MKRLGVGLLVAAMMMKIDFKHLKRDFIIFFVLVLFSCNNPNYISGGPKSKNDSGTSCMMVPQGFRMRLAVLR
jgi:hypothetical protein